MGKSEDGKPKVWLSLDAVQFIKQHKSMDSVGGLGDAGFGAVEGAMGAGASDGFDDNLDDDLGLGGGTASPEVSDDDLFG